MPERPEGKRAGGTRAERRRFWQSRFWRRPSPSGAYGEPGQGRSLGLSIATTAGILLAWYGVTAAGWIEPLFLPGPRAVMDRLLEVAREGFGGATLWEHVWASSKRVALAFLLAVVTAIPVGVLMGVSRIARGVLDPPVEFYRPIPPLAYLPLMVIWFGIGELTKVVVITLAIFAPMALNARAGVRSVPIEQIQAAYSLGASRIQVVWHVILRGAMPEILTGMRIGLGFGWTTLVAAELVAAQAGLGAMIQQASDFLVSDVVIMGIVVIGLIAYLSDLAMRFLERTLTPWKGKV